MPQVQAVSIPLWKYTVGVLSLGTFWPSTDRVTSLDFAQPTTEIDSRFTATNIIPRQQIDQHKISGNILLQMVTEPDAARIMGLRWVLNHFVGHPVDEGNKVFFMQELRHVTKTAGPQAGEVTYTHQESGHSLTLNSLGDIVAFLGGEAK